MGVLTKYKYDRIEPIYLPQSVVTYIYLHPVYIHNSKTVDEKEILRTVSNASIYCSSDKVATVYLV
jgi:hypothetical protein